MIERNIEEISAAREDEWYRVHKALIDALSIHGRHGSSEADDFWVPVEGDLVRDLYVLIANPAMLNAHLVQDIRRTLEAQRFIWVVILHFAPHDGTTDNRVLEITRTETVVLDRRRGGDLVHVAH